MEYGKGFLAFLEKVKKSEGLKWNKEKIEGEGGSYCGITRATFHEYQEWEECQFPKFPHNKFGTEHRHEPDIIKNFYYWYLNVQYKLECVPEWAMYPICDWVIQSASRAIKPLQERAGVDADGIIGSGTIAALTVMFEEIENDGDPDSDDHFVNWYCDQRKEFMTNWLNNEGKMESHGKGIYARLKKVRNIALQMCENDDIEDEELPVIEEEKVEEKPEYDVDLQTINSKLDAIMTLLKKRGQE